MDAEKEVRRLRDIINKALAELEDPPCYEGVCKQARKILEEILSEPKPAEPVYEEWPLKQIGRGLRAIPGGSGYSIDGIWPGCVLRSSPHSERRYRVVAYVHERGDMREELQELMAWHPSGEDGIGLWAGRRKGRWLPAVAVKVERLSQEIRYPKDLPIGPTFPDLLPPD